MLYIFEKSWIFLRLRRLEEILILIGMGLVWSLHFKGFKSDTTEFLEKIKYEKFDWSGGMCCQYEHLTLSPLLKLKRRFQEESFDQIDPHYEGLREALLAIIQSYEIVYMAHGIYLHHEILIQWDFILVRLSRVSIIK